MKKLSIIGFIICLLIMAMIVAANAQSCDKNVTAWGVSINAYTHQYPGIAVEGAYLAQEGKMGGSIGISVAPIRYEMQYVRVVGGREERGVETVRTANVNMWTEILYKLIQKDYKYSVSTVTGVTIDGYKGFSLHGGINVRMPSGYKAYFVQALYRTDRVAVLRIGIYLP